MRWRFKFREALKFISRPVPLMILKEYKKLQSVFILCESCHWCATYLDRARLVLDFCAICNSRNLSSFPILPDESFSFNYTLSAGVEMEFKRRK
jgi:hypothetical protein